jgi:hypothetical protein
MVSSSWLKQQRKQVLINLAEQAGLEVFVYLSLGMLFHSLTDTQ